MSDSPEQRPLPLIGQGSSGQDPALQPAAADLLLEAYSEVDDVATRCFETPRPPETWIVQVSLFERPLMSRDQLLEELQNGLVRESTLVWRAGMRDWCAVAQVEELRRALPLHLLQQVPASPRRRSKPRSAASVVWWCGAAALLTLSGTLYALSAGGVFDTGMRAQRAHPSALAASVRVP
jgi:hypothetical protein